MKTSIYSLLAGLMLMAASALYAQPQQGRENMTPEQRAEVMTQRMKSELNLTDTQVEAVGKLNLSFYSQGSLRDPEVRREAMAKRDAELKKILKPEQYEKWNESRQERMRSPGQQQQQQRQGRPNKRKNNRTYPP